jgi:DNA-binding HxlR family transcriptional regulator
MRAGGQSLTLLGAPRIYLILASLAEGTKGQLELRRDAGAPAQSTLRGHLRTLETATAIVRRRRDSFPGTLEYDLTGPGRELLEVAESLERWLADAPRGPLELGGDPARAAIKGLVEGWSTTVLPALAAGPLSLTELDKQVSAATYPTIERCLETMRITEQLEVGIRSPRGTPYSITDWLRRGLGPLVAGARWEHRVKLDGAAPICHVDIGDSLALVEPLLEFSAEASGICQLAVRVSDSNQQRRAMGWVEVHQGQLVFGPVYPQRKPDAWASGTIDSWFSAVADADTAGLKLSGDCDLTRIVLDRPHKALFAHVGTADEPQ